MSLLLREICKRAKHTLAGFAEKREKDLQSKKQFAINFYKLLQIMVLFDIISSDEAYFCL